MPLRSTFQMRLIYLIGMMSEEPTEDTVVFTSVLLLNISMLLMS